MRMVLTHIVEVNIGGVLLCQDSVMVIHMEIFCCIMG